MDNKTNGAPIISIFILSLAVFASILLFIKLCSREHFKHQNFEQNIQTLNTQNNNRHFIGLINKPKIGPKQFNPELGYASLYDKEPYIEYHNNTTPIC